MHRPRTDGLPGPSQPLPGSLASPATAATAAATPTDAAAVGGADGTAGRYTWMADLPPHLNGPDGWGDAGPVDALPAPIPRVWGCVDSGEEAQPGAVQYDAWFQGFYFLWGAAGKPPATTFLTAAAHHIRYCAVTPAGLNLRAGAASWAAPRSPPRGLAAPSAMRMHAAIAGPRPCTAAGPCAAAAVLENPGLVAY